MACLSCAFMSMPPPTDSINTSSQTHAPFLARNAPIDSEM